MYHYKGKPITVHADNDGGLWFYDDRCRVRTVKEDRVEQFERQFEVLQGLCECEEKTGS